MAPWFLAVLAGCAPDSDYTLAIEPVAPPNLSMAIVDPDVTLVHRTDRATLYPLGPLADGAFDDLPPLRDGTVGLLLSDSGTASETYDPRTLLGYGEAALGGDLGNDGATRTVRMLVTEFAGVGDLGDVPPRRAPVRGAAALTPDGQIFTFGGHRDGTPHALISRVVDVRTGDWDVLEVGTMPGVTGGSVLHTATALDDGTILVTGGRPAYFSISDNHPNAFVYDPSTQSTVWEASNGMNPGRSRHQAVKLRTGRVLVFGGWQGAGVDATEGTFQIFDPERQRFADSGTTTVGPLGANLADLGPDGVVACGGLSFDYAQEMLFGTTDCARISLSGDVIPFPALPEPVSMGAMAALPDGRILLAGGVLGDVPIPFEDGFLAGTNVGTAIARAWLYEPGPGAWREVGRLAEARAGAAAVPSGDGRVLVIGGAAEAGVMIAEDTGPVFCAEVYDPDAEAFVPGGSCSTPGSGAFPQVSAQPGIGALVVEGHRTEDGADAGGQAFGIIGLAPTL